MTERNEMMNYIKQRDTRKESLIRVYSGICQIVHHPIYVTVLFFLTVCFGYAWKNRGEFIDISELPDFLEILYIYSISFVVIVTYVLSILFYLKMLGVMSSRRDEADLTKAFMKAKKDDGQLIRISKAFDKKSGNIQRKFYTDIPLSVWMDKKVKDYIQTQMNEELVFPEFELGGKHKKNTRIVVMYSKSTKNSDEKEQLYDEWF